MSDIPSSSASSRASTASAAADVGPDFRTRSGMGMRFLELSPEVTKQLDELYESAFHRADRKQ